MVFQIPQFIDVEDKIAANLTIRQLIYIVIVGIVCTIAFFIFPTVPALFISLLATVAGGSFAFWKPNGQPFNKVAFSVLVYLWKPRLYLWKREAQEMIFEAPEEEKEAENSVVEKRKNLQEFSANMPLVKKLWSDLATTKNPIPKREKKIVEPDVAINVFKKASGETGVAKRVDYR